MTSGTESSPRVAVIGTGLMGTSIALASVRAGCAVRGWDLQTARSHRAAERGGFTGAADMASAVEGAEVVVVATPIQAVAATVDQALSAAPGAVVTDIGSVKAPLVAGVADMVPKGRRGAYVPGHPMGGSERAGPDHASASVVDAIVWAVTPTPDSDEACVKALERWITLIGARPVRMDPVRHDRLVAFVSHLPQVASTALMSLAATEEADEPEILLLAAGGFRDLTRLAASNPGLWSDILLSNREAIGLALDLYVARLAELREAIVGERGAQVEATFEQAKQARLRLAAKPQVRAGVAVLQVQLPDTPGALAQLTAILGRGAVNIEDLQIVHSPEGGHGTVHLTVAVGAAADASGVLAAGGFDPLRLA